MQLVTCFTFQGATITFDNHAPKPMAWGHFRFLGVECIIRR